MEEQAERQFARIAPAAFAVSLVALFIALPSIDRFSRFSPDAWTVYELAKTVGGDFFRANTVREFRTHSAYSSAFAPLWPVVISVFTRITGDIHGSYVAAFLAYAAFAAAAEVFARRAFGQRGIGVMSALLMLQFIGVREELSSGRSIPMCLFELALVGTLLIGLRSASLVRCALVGLIAGAMAMTRFDAMPGAVALVLGAPFIGVSRTRLACLVAGVALAISPWVFFSLTHFHTLFASDNSAVVLAVDPGAFVHDFHARPQLTLVDAPAAWVWKLVRHTLTIGLAFLHAVRESLFLPVLLVIVALHMRARGARRPISTRATWPELALFTAITLAPFAGYVLTGYWDHRYFTAAIWLAELFALAWITRGTGKASGLVVLGLVAVAALSSISELRHAARSNPFAAVRRKVDRVQVDELASCLERNGARKTDAVVFAGLDVVSRYEFGALTGWRVLPLPSNWERLGRMERDAFLRAYEATYVVDSRPAPEVPIALGATAVGCSLPLQLMHLRR